MRSKLGTKGFEGEGTALYLLVEEGESDRGL